MVVTGDMNVAHQEIDLKMEPTKEKKPLLNIRLPLSSTKLKIAFIYEKTPGTSAWTYAHELGRLHLEQAFSDEVTMVSYENGTQENIDSLLENAIESGCNLIFTTTPSFVQALRIIRSAVLSQISTHLHWGRRWSTRGQKFIWNGQP